MEERELERGGVLRAIVAYDAFEFFLGFIDYEVMAGSCHGIASATQSLA